MACAHFGDEAGKRFCALVNSGVTAEMLKAARSFNIVNDQAESRELASIKKVLGELKTDIKKTESSGDFLSLVAQHQEAHGCSKVSRNDGCAKVISRFT